MTQLPSNPNINTPASCLSHWRCVMPTPWGIPLNGENRMGGIEMYQFIFSSNHPVCWMRRSRELNINISPASLLIPCLKIYTTTRYRSLFKFSYREQYLQISCSRNKCSHIFGIGCQACFHRNEHSFAGKWGSALKNLLRFTGICVFLVEWKGRTSSMRKILLTKQTPWWGFLNAQRLYKCEQGFHSS